MLECHGTLQAGQERAADRALVTYLGSIAALSGDDVTDGASARLFVAERLAESAGLLGLVTRTRIGALADAVIAERAP